jgi:hypothetical protein
LKGKKEERMGVSRRNVTVLVALVAVLALAIPVLARASRTAITLTDACQLAGTKIPPGEYVMVVDGNKVTLLHNDKVVATATGEWKKADGKFHDSGFACNSEGRVVQVRVEGRDSYLEIG